MSLIDDLKSVLAEKELYVEEKFNEWVELANSTNQTLDRVLLTSGYPRDAFSEGRRFPLLSKPYPDVSLAQSLRAVLDGRQEPEK